MALRRRGIAVHPISWTPPTSLDAAEPFVAGEVEPVLTAAGDRPLLVGKSLGTYAARLATRFELPAIWFTPLLRQPTIVTALRAAGAPMLLVGGTADPSWDGAVARALSPHVHEVRDADHSLLVPGPLADSARVLGEVTAAVERFLDEVVTG